MSSAPVSSLEKAGAVPRDIGGGATATQRVNDVISILIPSTAHTADLRSPTEKDGADLAAAREITAQIAQAAIESQGGEICTGKSECVMDTKRFSFFTFRISLTFSPHYFCTFFSFSRTPTPSAVPGGEKGSKSGANVATVVLVGAVAMVFGAAASWVVFHMRHAISRGNNGERLMDLAADTDSIVEA